MALIQCGRLMTVGSLRLRFSNTLHTAEPLAIEGPQVIRLERRSGHCSRTLSTHQCHFTLRRTDPSALYAACSLVMNTSQVGSDTPCLAQRPGSLDQRFRDYTILTELEKDKDQKAEPAKMTARQRAEASLWYQRGQRRGTDTHSHDLGA